MKISLADWEFSVDVEETTLHSMNCSVDHCLCAYCRNYYETVDGAHPTLRRFLAQFGLVLEGPSEVMPLEPTLVMTAYRIIGEITRFGTAKMHADNIPIYFEVSENGTFLLWAGEMELPWEQNEPMEDVVSPANEPEFLQRMARKWAQLNDLELILS